jgi:8-oxo-dGTP pyrophosphatase MutT (NUDIX family)
MTGGPGSPGEEAGLFLDPLVVGLGEAEALGRPLRESRALDPAAFPKTREFPILSPRRAEILMVLPRPGGLLLHTKSFYPPGVLRLLSGGVLPGEPVLHAAEREVREETGLALAPQRFLFHLVFRILEDPGPRPFHTLAFLYPASTAPVAAQDAEEEISRFAEVPWERLPEMARSLEEVDPRWRLWGHFRAEPHRLLWRLLRDDPGLLAGG